METTEINIALDFDKLEEIYTYFVEKFINIQTELKQIELYTNNNNTALTDAITLFKADIIDHYLEVAEMLDTQGLITNAFDAYECITDNRTECIFPNAVSEHLETCSRASVLFGENGQFLSFNSLIQVAEESMCSTNTTCIDTQDTDWSELVYTWTYGLQSVSTDRWICVNFNDIASNVQGPRNRLRADKHTYGKQIANYLQEQKDSNGAFNIASSGLSDAFNAFSVTTIPTYDATKDIMADVFVDDSSNMQCTIDCRLYVLDICCIDPNALKTMFHKNNDKYKVQYSSRVKTFKPELYDRDEITITTEIAEPAVRYGYLAASESTALVEILKLLNVTGCEKVAECKKKASDAIDCTYNVNTRNENSDCDIGSLFLPDDRDTETVYTSSDLGTSSPIPLTAYTPDTTTCTVEQDTTKNTFDECKTHLIKELYHKSGSYTRNDFIFGHYTGTSCKLYKCTKTTFLENKAEGEGQDGQLIPLKPVQNKTVIIDVLQAGNSNVNPLALACPVNYNATCTACQGGWSDGNTARGAWTNIDASKQNPANPQNWGQCSETSERKRDSTDTQNYCDTTQTKDCQLVDVTSASFDKSTGKLTVQWTNKASPLRDSINFLTIKHDNTYTIITDGSSQKVIDSATPPDIHLYRSDTSGNDLGDKTVRVCAQHVADYNAYPVTVSPGCTTASSTERQLKPITTNCVVDTTSSYGACQNDNKQYKELLQIKLPYDGSDAYNGCDATRTCYVCADGDGNPSKDETNACTQCDAGFKSGPKNDKNARECVACTGDTYQNQAGQSTCPDRTICQPGQYVDDDGSSTTNRVCQPCAKGSKSTTTNQGTCDVCDGSTKYQDETGQSSCKTVSSCPAGQGVTQNATSESNTVCENCDGVNKYSDVDSKTAACKDTVTQCDAGFKFVPPTTTSKGACQECTGSTFISASNHQQTSCTTHATCVAGQYVTQTPSSTRNRLCQACPVGSVSSGENQASCTVCDGTNEYQDQTGQTSCKTASTCEAGKGVTIAHTTTANTQCETCDGTNKYSNVDSYDACQAVNVCAASEAELTAPTSTSDRECQCAAGYYVDAGSCQACPSGRYQPSANAVATCPNTWSNCAAGTYISVVGTTTSDRSCASCTSGFTNTANQNSCTAYTACDTNKYVSVDGTTTTDQTCADKKADNSTCAANQECTSGSCDSGTCGTSCNDNTDCTASQYCDGVSGFCKDKVGQDESCGITDECLDNLFCDVQGSGQCKTCDDAGYGNWTADGSCTSGGWQVDAPTVKHGSTSSTKYLSESSAQNACTSGCQGITRWAVNSGSTSCSAAGYASYTQSQCGSRTCGSFPWSGPSCGGNDCTTTSDGWSTYHVFNVQCGTSWNDGYSTFHFSCKCQYWTIDDGSTSDITDTAVSSKTLQNNQPLIRSTEDTDVCTDTSKTIACGTCPDGTECPSGQTCNTDLNPNTCEASGGGGGGGNCGEHMNRNDCVGDCVWNENDQICNDSSSGGGTCSDYGEACGAGCCEGLTCTADTCK